MTREAIYEYACIDLDGEPATCWLRQFSDEPCSGRLEKAHLIRQQTIRREVLSKLDDEEDLWAIMWDPRVWRPGCEHHHHQLDKSKRLRIPRSSIPADTEQYAREHGISWWLCRTYGEITERVA